MPTSGGLCPWQVVVGGGVRRAICLPLLLLVGAVAWPGSPAWAEDWATTSLSIPPGSYYIAWDSPANPTGGRRLLLSDNPVSIGRR